MAVQEIKRKPPSAARCWRLQIGSHEGIAAIRQTFRQGASGNRDELWPGGCVCLKAQSLDTTFWPPGSTSVANLETSITLVARGRCHVEHGLWLADTRRGGAVVDGDAETRRAASVNAMIASDRHIVIATDTAVGSAPRLPRHEALVHRCPGRRRRRRRSLRCDRGSPPRCQGPVAGPQPDRPRRRNRHGANDCRRRRRSRGHRPLAEPLCRHHRSRPWPLRPCPRPPAV